MWRQEKKDDKNYVDTYIYFILTTKMNTKTYVRAQHSHSPFQHVAHSSGVKVVMSWRAIFIWGSRCGDHEEFRLNNVWGDICSSETSEYLRTTRRYNFEDKILHSYVIT
jgi:hypothetical protein